VIKLEITPNILVVDNNSTDRTTKVSRKAGAVVIWEQKEGYGSACLAGIRFLSLKTVKPKFIGFFDGDGQSLVQDIIKVANPVINRGIDYCQGSRILLETSKRSLGSKAIIANTIFAWIIRKTYHQQISDLGPLRVMSWETLERLKMKSQGYGWTIEMSTKIMKTGVYHVEIPVHYQKRKSGRSKISGSLPVAFKAAIVMGITFLWILLFWKYSYDS
jgi:glycosyltransferase involved in cell wall biosynthesis